MLRKLLELLGGSKPLDMDDKSIYTYQVKVGENWLVERRQEETPWIEDDRRRALQRELISR